MLAATLVVEPSVTVTVIVRGAVLFEVESKLTERMAAW